MLRGGKDRLAFITGQVKELPKSSKRPSSRPSERESRAGTTSDAVQTPSTAGELQRGTKEEEAHEGAQGTERERF